MLMLLLLSSLSAHENALIHEGSPYLQRHAHNPVNWYAWNDKTLALAKKENKPIFLSIGYSTCHWCHVMEEESFEHEEVAKVLNQYFISIKVDREEFPNIDKKYQNLFRSLNGKRGGWPLSVFLTPELKPFFITTYMPRSGYGKVEGIVDLAERLGKLYADKSKLKLELQKFAKAQENINKPPKPSAQTLELKSLLSETLTHIEKEYDAENGGFSTARTKFPEASKIELLLNIYKINGDQKALSMAKETLIKMSKRGIYDQVDGGFFRYANGSWTVPHFQKLLYVNAQLPLAYLEMYRISKDTYFFDIAKATIDEMERNYTQDEFYISASDSVGVEGEEGVYFAYLYDEVKEGLKKEGLKEALIEEILAYLTIEEFGNIDGELSHINIASIKAPEKIDLAMSYLQKVRKKRSFPFRDKKVITSWSAMMIKTLYVMGRYDTHYLAIANKRLDALLGLMQDEEGLYHQTLPPKKPMQKAQLEDYAYLVDTLLTAYQVTLDKEHLSLASQLAFEAKNLFLDKEVWYMSREEPKVRADFDDKYYSSALAILLNGFLTLGNLHDDLPLSQESQRMVNLYANLIHTHPQESSSLVILALRLNTGVVTLKAKKSALEANQQAFWEIDYPFLLRKSHQYDEYIACKLGLCLVSSKEFNQIRDAISKMKKELIEKPKKKKWGKLSL